MSVLGKTLQDSQLEHPSIALWAEESEVVNEQTKILW